MRKNAGTAMAPTWSPAAPSRPTCEFPDDKERFFKTVKLGKNDKMPPMGDLLNDEQIATLWAFAVEPEDTMRSLAGICGGVLRWLQRCRRWPPMARC